MQGGKGDLPCYWRRKGLAFVIFPTVVIVSTKVNPPPWHMPDLPSPLVSTIVCSFDDSDDFKEKARLGVVELQSGNPESR